MKKLYYTYATLLLLTCITSCITVVEQKEPKKEKSERDIAQDELDKMAIMMKHEEARYKHIKKSNPEPLIIVKSYHIKSKKDITYFTVTIKNNTAMTISYYYLKWLLYDKSGNEVQVEKDQGGSSGPVTITPGQSHTESWIFSPAPTIKTAKFSFKTVQFQEDMVWDYENAKSN